MAAESAFYSQDSSENRANFHGRRWTPEDEALLRRLWADDSLERIDIAARLNRTIPSCNKRAVELRLSRRRPRSPHAHPPALVAAVVRSWPGDGSATAIGKKYGLSRNAVLALLWRSRGGKSRAFNREQPPEPRQPYRPGVDPRPVFGR